MAWFLSAISKAAEVGGKNIAPNISETVRNVAQQAGQAVAGGAKLVQDHLVGRNLNSFKNAVRRLDEVALTARGDERTQALARWLGVLKEIGKEIKPSPVGARHKNGRSDDGTIIGGFDEAYSPRRASMVFFYDFERDGEPMTFRDVFLSSHAIENIVTSMILQAPIDDEISMLLDIFGLCLDGGKELHTAIISSIQDLSKAFQSYTEEFTINREELLQYIRDAISGLKLNAEVERLDAEIATLKLQVAEKQANDGINEDANLLQLSSSIASGTSGDILLNEDSGKTNEILKVGIKLHNLLQRKNILLHGEDFEESKASKIELLKAMIKSTQEWTTEQEEKISDNKSQKASALKYWVTKAQEMLDNEKPVLEEVKMLEKKRDELELQLKEVKAALAAATSKHINSQEEKQKFDEVNSEILARLTEQEEELSRSFTSHSVEAGVAKTCLSFLEDTWRLQSSFMEQSEKNVLHALSGVKEQFLPVVIANLTYHKDEFSLLVNRLKDYSKELKDFSDKKAQVEVATNALVANLITEKHKLQEEYLKTEEKAIQILRAVEILKDGLQSFEVNATGNGSDLEIKVIGLLEAINQVRRSLESIERPDVGLEKLLPKARDDSPKGEPTVEVTNGAASPQCVIAPVTTTSQVLASGRSSEETEKNEPKSALVKNSINDNDEDKEDDDDDDDDEILPESTEMKGLDFSLEETAGWEFDELEEELNREGA